VQEEVVVEKPLPEGVLEINYGIPIMVVACKSDMQEESLKEGGLD
jgi:hypothetical protein